MSFRINIAGLTPVDDPQYRYKMPLVLGRVEKGKRTVLLNIEKVAKSLHRAAGEIVRFFGCELSVHTSYCDETGRAIVKGMHTNMVLQAMIHRYIEYFVLCPICRLPETGYVVGKSTIYHKCHACGAKEKVDICHQLCTYILAQSRKANGDRTGFFMEDTTFGNTEHGLVEGMHNLGVNGGADDGADAADRAVEATRNFLTENPDASVDEIIKVVTNQQRGTALMSHDMIHVLVRAAVSPNVFKKQEIETYAPVVSKMVNGDTCMERHLIAALEALSLQKPKNFPIMLMKFYEGDALTEETILEWAAEGRNKKYTVDVVDEKSRALLRSEAESVVAWLQEADTDDEDEDE